MLPYSAAHVRGKRWSTIKNVAGATTNARQRGLSDTKLESGWDKVGSSLNGGQRLIGSIRRECLDHVIVINERHLKRILRSYFSYYLHWRTHLPLDRNAPIEREVEPPWRGRVVAIPQVGGPLHRYCRAV